MGLDLFLAFIAATLLLCITPGPVVTWLVACGIRGGARASLTGLAGTTSAIIVHMSLLLAGLAPLLAAMGTYMEVLKLIGAAYLIWIGIAAFRAPIMDPALPATVLPDSKARLFRCGFLIGVTNPKPLIFYAAFFPQFIDPAEPASPQLLLLAVTFLAVAILSDGTYALAAGRLAPYLKARRAQLISNRITGTVLIASGAALALARR